MIDPFNSLKYFLSLRILQVSVGGKVLGLGIHLRHEFSSQSAPVPNYVMFTLFFTALTLVYSIITTPFTYCMTFCYLYVTTIIDVLLGIGSLLVAIQMNSKFYVLLCQNNMGQDDTSRSCTWQNSVATVDNRPVKIGVALSILCWYA